MIAIVDYGAGNLFSVKNACDFLGLSTQITGDAAALRAADGIILPGVGAFPDAMRQLTAHGLTAVLQEEATKKPLLGICLGMQMLFEFGMEFERTEGLGLLPGFVARMETGGRKLPHVGWNELRLWQPSSPLLERIKEGDFVYFVHSYGAVCPQEVIVASCTYGGEIPALVGQGMVFGAQFHPEKSGTVGLLMLKNFGKLVSA